MKIATHQELCCPLCQQAMTLRIAEDDGDEVIAGQLVCSQCGEEYPINKRLPDLIPRTRTEATKLREMDGWVNLWEKKGMYAHPTLEDSFRLPYVGGIWTENARMFDLALDELQLRGGETTLDVGAGQGWASRYFAAHGANAYAIDIVADEWYGLGRAWSIMEYAGVYFEPMLADGERLPFPSGHFDVVFFSAALHHFERPETVLKQMYRVLKPGGRLIAAGEPAISIFVREQDVQAILEEVDEGIIERRPKPHDYRRYLEKAGFTDIQLDSYGTYCGDADEIRKWIKSESQRMVKVVRTRYKPVAWAMPYVMRLLPARVAGRLLIEIFGANLFIRARRP